MIVEFISSETSEKLFDVEFTDDEWLKIETAAKLFNETIEEFFLKAIKAAVDKEA